MKLITKSRRERYFLSLLIIILFSLVSAQVKWETQLHQLFQIENSDKEVKHLFRSLGIPYKSDTVYAFIVPPMVAARVEGAINPFIAHLRRQGVKEDIILLAVSDKRRAAERYLKRRNFNADYQLVVGEGFLNPFEFSAGDLQVPFVTKFSISSGELLTSKSLMGAIDSVTVAAFVADISKPRTKRKPEPASSKLQLKGERYKPVFGKKIKLYDNEDYPLSTTYHISVNPFGTRLALMDQMSYYIYIFDLTTGKLINAIYPDSTEEGMFVNLPRELLTKLKEMNIITNPMYFSHQFSDDTTLMITASFPMMVIEATGKDTNVAYHNAPVLIRKSISSNRLLSCCSFQNLPENVRGNFFHTDATIVPQAGLIFTPFSKGWPKGSEMLDEQRTPLEENPFTDEFYQEDIYQFAVFDTNGRFIRFLGRLSKQFESLKLGYLVSEGLVKFQNNRFLTTDRYSGKIYFYTLDFALDDSITLFDNSPSIVPAIDRSNEPLRYLLETFKSNFKRRIVDFFITSNTCYALITEDAQPVLYKHDLSHNRTRRFMLPLQLGKMKAKYYLLRGTPSGVYAVSLLESQTETWYCEFKLP
ncbi:MAG: hypothetical protein WHU95_00020 [candidate division WOR-3 bacterium]|jgi:hypothetical protein|nr:hypothetical protein [candidate division WOR-3 bacterium]MDH7519765.1 hypothetical protein [bacterium]